MKIFDICWNNDIIGTILKVFVTLTLLAVILFITVRYSNKFGPLLLSFGVMGNIYV